MIQTLLVPYAKSSPVLDVDLLGLTFRERIKRQAKVLGFNQVIFLSDGREVSQLPGRLVIYFPNVLLSNAVMSRLQNHPVKSEGMAAFEAFESCVAIRTENAAALLELLRRSAGYDEFLKSIKPSFKWEKLSITRKEWIFFKTKDDASVCRQWLLRGLIKDTEGFMSKHFERKISLTITRFLVHTPISPNAMTVISSLIGVGGSFLFIAPEKWYHFWGAALFWLHSVLDGCDGEIARLKFLESRFGGLMDFWGDNLVHASVFSMIALGFYKREMFPWVPALGLVAVGGTLLSATLVYWKTMRGKKDPGPVFTTVAGGFRQPSGIQKVADFLARRDFIYLVIILAFFGKVHWFLWMGAVGSPIYFLTILFLNAGKRKTA